MERSVISERRLMTSDAAFQLLLTASLQNSQLPILICPLWSRHKRPNEQHINTLSLPVVG